MSSQVSSSFLNLVLTAELKTNHKLSYLNLNRDLSHFTLLVS